MYRLLLWTAASIVPALAQTSGEQAVIAAVQRTFDGMAARDAAMIRSAFVPQAMLFLINGQGEARAVSVEQFATGVAGLPTVPLERMWDPKVRIEGKMATLWTPYDFHIDGKFSHCGVDAVQLVQVGGEWKITAITYTMQREGCAPSPLGPPPAKN
jgi:hypothetical protein